MGLFSGMSDAEVGTSKVYFLPGDYVVQIRRVIYKDGRRDKFYIAECLILESTNPERPKGTSASWLQKMSGASAEVALGAIKGFLAACEGVDPLNKDAVTAAFTDQNGQDISEEIATMSVDEAQNPLGGVVLRLNAVQGETKDGRAFTYHNWRPAQPGDEQLANG